MSWTFRGLCGGVATRNGAGAFVRTRASKASAHRTGQPSILLTQSTWTHSPSPPSSQNKTVPCSSSLVVFPAQTQTLAGGGRILVQFGEVARCLPEDTLNCLQFPFCFFYKEKISRSAFFFFFFYIVLEIGLLNEI